MKNATKKILVLALVLMMILPSVLAFSVSAQDTAVASDTDTGVSFTSTKTFTLPSSVKNAPLTMEAVLRVPKGTGRAGVILGNYADNVDTVCFEIHENGKPRLYAKKGSTLIDIKLNTDIRSDDYIHLALVIDTVNTKVICYVNGIEAASATDVRLADFTSYIPKYQYQIGGDCRGGNSQYFKGKIKNIALYSDVRTKAEIVADASLNMNGLGAVDKNQLVAAYDIAKPMPECIADLSGNGHKLKFYSPEFEQQMMKDGMTFKSTDTYKMYSAFAEDDRPVTIEATMFVPKDKMGRTGVVMGNYSQGKWSMTFELINGGQPRIYFETLGGQNQTDLIFSNVDARTGYWAHVAIVIDIANGKATCYLDGKEMQTLSITQSVDYPRVFETPFYLGRDTRSGSESKYFQGALKSVALYSDIRTAEEILSDCEGADLTDNNIIAAYNLLEETGRQDLTGNKYNIYYEGEPLLPDQNEGGDTGGDEGGDEGDDTDAPTTLDGLTFTSSTYAIVEKNIKNQIPLTFEATILVPEDVTGRAGIIFGNYCSYEYKYLSFEIYENGQPRIAFNNTNERDARSFVFNNVKVNTGKAVHLAITVDSQNGAIRCYVDGELKQTVYTTLTAYDSEVFDDYLFLVGNDLRSGSEQYFKGTIGNLTLYSDVRSAEEIKSDFEATNTSCENIVLHYDFSNSQIGSDVEDKTGNGYALIFDSKAKADQNNWIIEKEEVKDYLYSFAVVGDTQIINRYHGEDFHKIYDWILANKSIKNIQYVFGLGDITDADSSGEWERAEEIFRLNGEIPYSVVRGNHDSASKFNSLFANDASYVAQFGGFFAENDARNSWRKITIGGNSFLMITLDYGASDDVLSWAGDIIEENSDSKVIISTHAYLFRDGTTLDSDDVCPPKTSGGYNNGDHIWDKLISQYENVFLVLSGHDPSAQVVVSQTEGVHGNIVTQMLIDPQGVDTSTPTGMVTMLYFKADGSIEVETYSTIQESYYKESNQFVVSETEHDYSKNIAYEYANGYLQAGVMSAECVHCGKTRQEAADAIFVYKGYSVKEENTAICVGYFINYELLSEYETVMCTEISIGAVTCASDNLVNGDNKPINSDGSAAEVSAGRVVHSLIESERRNVSIILKTDDWTKYADKKIILCAYIIENGKVSYLCGNVASESAAATTYNEIIEELAEEAE